MEPRFRELPASWVTVLLGLLALSLWWTGLSWLQGGAPYGDDNSSHIAVILHLATLLKQGHTDFFFAQNNLGVALFLSYQPLPAFFMAILVALTSWFLSPILLFKLSILSLWSLIPVTWYIGGRWLGLSRTSALVLALLTLGIEDPQAYGFTFTSVAYKGLYTQSYGLLFFPLGLGAWWRWLRTEEGSLSQVVLWMCLTFLSHIFFGLYLGIASLLMVVGGGWRERARRAFFGYLLPIAVMAFWMLPLLLNVEYVGGLPWKGITHNGWPLVTSVKRFLGGVLFDNLRFPWMTLLLLLSLSVLVRQWKRPQGAWLLGLWMVTWCFFLGRTNLGTLYSLIPLHKELNVMRYLSGIHICGLLTLAMAVEWLRQQSWERGWWLRSIGFVPVLATVGVVAVILYGGIRVRELGQRLHSFQHQSVSFQALQKHLREDRNHRFVVDGRLKTTSHFHRDLLPALTNRPQLQSYGMTFHAHLSLFYAEFFDFSPAAYRLFNVTAAVARTKKPNIPLKHVVPAFESGSYTVFSPKNRAFGMFDFVRIPFAIRGNYKDIRWFVKKRLMGWFGKGILPLMTRKKSGLEWEVRIHKGQKPQYFHKGKQQPRHVFEQYVQSVAKAPSLRSKLLKEKFSLTSLEGKVSMKQAGFVLVKLNYFPFWKAWTGRAQRQIVQVAPGFMAVHLPAGTHTLRLEYKNPLWQKFLFVVTVLFLLGWVGHRLRDKVVGHQPLQASSTTK